MTKKVLLIEDDYAIIRGLKDSFLEKKYDVTTAMDGEQALKAVKEQKFSLILLDIMLPKINGFEVCAQIRELEIDTPIIILTAKGEDKDIIRGLNFGADDYVTKPFSIAQLHARANALLRRYQTEQKTEHRFGRYHLDTTSRQLHTSDNTQIKLTPKEYALLEFFLSRAGKALTRSTLLNAVWHSSVLTTERSVDRCVNTLRKKIEDNSREPKHIISVRDIGYRFET